MESFWNTPYGHELLSVEQTEIDKLLSSPRDATLEDLFDEDELLQQCSNKNSKLIEFLSQKENISKLVSYITRPWQEHMQQIINHLKQQQEDQEYLSRQASVDGNSPSPILPKNNPPGSSSPLSKGGTNIIGPITEEDADTNTPQSLADALMSLEDDHPLDADQNMKAPDDEKQTVQDDFDKDEQLKLSDDEQEEENENQSSSQQDAAKQQESADGAAPPTLKKKGSIVDMLMAGPEFTDDTELAEPTETETKPNHDADPELPDLDVKKESDESPPKKDGQEENKDSVAEEEDDDDEIDTTGIKPSLIFDKENDDIPPPPPAQPSRLDEFKSDIGVEKVKLKYPYLASEIINCQIPQILDSILDVNNPYMDMLFDFIEQPAPLNAVLTNYWRSCIVGLVRRNSTVILKYIKSRKNLLSSLVRHIRDQSIMELVIALGWDPAIEELKELDEVADWMYQQELVPKLIATLAPERSPDEHSAASYTLVDIVAKTSRSTNLVLFHNLASAQQIDALMNHMFAGNRSSLLESLSVLLALLHHYPNVSAEKQQFGDEDEQTQHNDIPPPPPPLPPDDGTKASNDNNKNDSGMAMNPLAALQMVTANEQNDDNTTQANGAKSSPEPSAASNEPSKSESNDQANKPNVGDSAQKENDTQPPTKGGPQELQFEASIPSVVRAVCYRLGDFKRLLETEPDYQLELPFVQLSPPLGPVRHKIVDMIVALMRTPSSIVSQKLRELGLIKICIDLFFAYPWNNLLHGSVEHIIQMVVSGDCEILKKALFEDCDFLNRILEARQLSAKHQEEKKFRLGYMGHITRVSNTIVEFAKRNSQLEQYMHGNEQWMKFIGDDLKLENEQLNTQLGGHRPSTLNDEDGDEFTLFTLNDISNTGDTDDILGSNNYDDHDHEEDRDSDSDSDDENDANKNKAAQSGDAQTENKDKAEDYEMPQDAFSRLTQTIDQLNEQNENQSKTEQPSKGKDDADEFENWLNTDNGWNDFGNERTDKDNKKSEAKKPAKDDKPAEQSSSNEKDAENTTQSKDTNAKEDVFASWDEDPFANDGDDLFGGAQANNSNTESTKKEKNAAIQVETHDPNEDGLEIPDTFTPSPNPPENDNAAEHVKESNGHSTEQSNSRKPEESASDATSSDAAQSNAPKSDLAAKNADGDKDATPTEPPSVTVSSDQ
mmetsp:Transcript_19327/g.30654  ORF Transcript_19327/g.30654 Transcript_19327/m.30654 type:complete len:1174 (+) Transcript_19327:224-3745(+)